MALSLSSSPLTGCACIYIHVYSYIHILALNPYSHTFCLSVYIYLYPSICPSVYLSMLYRKSWTAQKLSSLSIPKPNPFIPQDFTLQNARTKGSAIVPPPTLVMDTGDIYICVCVCVLCLCVCVCVCVCVYVYMYTYIYM
jgi:hypothetical protein